MFDLEKVFAIKHQQDNGASQAKKGLTLKILVDSKDDHVKIQLPLGFVKAVIKMSPHWLEKKVNHDGVDMTALFEAIEDNLVGEFINIQEASGDHVRIVIE